jgi:hypothetical protein
MMIKDLEISKELSRKELSGVRGGVAIAVAEGQVVQQNGGSFFSPIVATNAPTATANDNDLHLSLKSVLVSQSIGSFVFQ